MLSLFSSLLFAQDKNKKSRSKYESLSERNISVDQSVPGLLQEAENLMVADPAAALDRVEQALATSITQKSSYNEAKCYLVLARINEHQGETELASQNYLDAYKRLVSVYNTTPDFRTTLEGLGRVNFNLSLFDQSKRFYEDLLNTEIDENKRLETELRIAEIEVALGNAPKALEKVSQLEPSLTSNESKSLQSRGRAIKARAYAQQDDFAAAENSLIQSADETAGESFFDTDSEILDEVVSGKFVPEDEEAEELLNIYQQQDRKEEEIALREKIAVSKADANLPLQATKQRQAIGKVLIEQGRTNDAISQLRQAAVLADSTGNFQEQANTYKALAEAYNQSGVKSKAIEAYKSHSLALENLIEQQQTQRSVRESLLKKQQDIQALTKDLALDESSYLLEETTTELQAQQLRGQRLLIYGLIGLLVLVITATYYIYRNAMKTKRVGQLLALKSLRSQMNPHFIFNALNSVNQFVALNDERAANKFLAEFSKLMRMVLDNSQKEFISLREEQEMIALYLKLEHYRFRDQFDYGFEIDPSLDLDELEIPPMLIQPYIENAIWHGLRYKKEKGHLQVNIYQNGDGIKISIEDNGIGRVESARLKTDNQKKKNSVGVKNTLERIAIINQVYHTNYKIKITDLNEDLSGTCVEILTPKNHG
ncbi:histidine kinase [Reichenbachiella sp.]|uniref:tetratricopeptide repeat-containing sensor histidine kinase n=1 Tax=Reichenbachiella sp. TaxID=2184521 RepID=UPI003296A098